MNDLEFDFRTSAEAQSFGAAYVEDEPGWYFTIEKRLNGRFYVNIFEEDGYWVNRPIPRITCTSPVTAPRRMAQAHLG